MASKEQSAAGAGARRGRIVVGVDGSDGATRALEWAAVQAARTGAVLEIHAASGPGSVLVAPSTVRKAFQPIVDGAAARAAQVAPEVITRSAISEHAPGVVLIEASEGADLLVVGSRGRGGFSGLLLGSIGRRCVHRARCPVVVVGPEGPASGRATARGTEQGSASTPVARRETAARADRRQRIVVGFDGSSSAETALGWAAHQAELTSASVEAITTWEWPTSYAIAGYVPPLYDPAADARQLLDGAIEKLQRSHPDIAFQPTVVQGHAAPALEEASKGADLLVVGSRGHGDLAGTLLGSVSEHCISHAHCPVVVLRYPDQPEPAHPSGSTQDRPVR